MSLPFFVNRKEGLGFAARTFYQGILMFLTLLTVFLYRQLFSQIHMVLMGTIASAYSVDEGFRNEFRTKTLILYGAVFVLRSLSEYPVMGVWVATLFNQMIKAAVCIPANRSDSLFEGVTSLIEGVTSLTLFV